jgi:hypothetical protein
MTEPQVASSATLDLPSDPGLALETTSRTTVLVTEHEVAFSTAAAVPFQPTTTRWWTRARRAVLLSIGTALQALKASPHPARRHYPARYSYLEHACMAREMHRL